MSRLGELIRTLCPDGVEYKPMGEIGTFTRGGGLQKKDFTESGVPCIHYGQIYTYYGVFAYETKSFVSPEAARKFKKAQTGDLIIATTSENIEDVCKCVVWLGEGEICVSGETYIFKHKQNPKYVAYCLQTADFFEFKKKNYTGTKVIRIHGDRLRNFEIPVPPMEVQEEIVRILDKFTALEAELEAELEARKKQYEHYRDNLLTFSGMGGVLEYETLEKLGKFYGGLTGKSKSDFDDGNAKFATYMNVFSNPALKIDVDTYVKVSAGEKQNAVQYGDVLFTGSSETPDECGMSSVVTEEVNEKMYLNSFCFGFRLNNIETFEPRFLKHLFRSGDIRKQITQTASGVTRFNVSKKRFGRVVIPIPPIEEQERIVGILDKFEAICTDLCEGLPAEIEARRRQYEHYRDKLLSFKRI